MKRVIPKVSRQFPQEFYDRLQSEQSLNKPFSASKNLCNNITGSPSQQISTYEDESILENTASFLAQPHMRVSQSQDSLFKSSKYDRKKQMEFTFCLDDNKNCQNKNSLRFSQSILPPLQQQNKGFNEQYHLVSEYQLIQNVKPQRKKPSDYQQKSPQSNDSDKNTNDQTEIQDQKTREDDDFLENKEQQNYYQLNENILPYFDFNKGLKKKQRNVNSLACFNSSINAQYHQNKLSDTLQVIKGKNKSQVYLDSTKISANSNTENVNPNIPNSEFLMQNISNNQSEVNLNLNQNNQMRQLYAKPKSQPFAVNRDVLQSQTRIPTLPNPSRSSYQSLLRESLVNQNMRQLNQVSPQRRLSNQDFEEDYFNNMRSQIYNNFSKQSNINHSTSAQNNQISKQYQINMRSQSNASLNLLKKLDVGSSKKMNTEQSDAQIKLNNKSKIISLPALNMAESQYQRKNQDQEKNNSERQTYNEFYDDVNIDSGFIQNKNKDFLQIKNNNSCIQSQIIPSPRLIYFQEKQKYYLTKNPQFNIQKIIPQPDGKQLISSPKTDPMRSKQNFNENQLNQLHSPEWFQNKLGRPILFSQQEKRLNVNQQQQRNIQSQQGNEEKQKPLQYMENIFTQN